MKKIQLNAAKLQLHKERISSLTNEEMSNVNGGGILWSLIGRCGTSSNQPAPVPQTTPVFTQDGAPDCQTVPKIN